MSAQVRVGVAAWLATLSGALVLNPVFAGPFLFYAALVCALVTGAGLFAQSRRVPAAITALVQGLVLIEVLALLFFRSDLRFGLVPGRTAVKRMGEQLTAAVEFFETYRAPLPERAELTFFAVAVTGLVGLAIHLIAVQFQQAAWAGLLLLSMYTVPAATLDGGLPMLLFVPPAVGYIVLLSAEARTRLSRWGRRISGVTRLDRVRPVEASALAQAGRRIGLTVVAVAALLPALLPELPRNPLEAMLGTGPGGAGTGSGTSVSRDPMLDMGKNLRRGDNAPAFTYRGEPTYFRLTTMDRFDGRRWRSSSLDAKQKVDGRIADAPPGYRRDPSGLRQIRYDVKVGDDLGSAWVPLPYPARDLSIKGDWRFHPQNLDVLTGKNDETVAGKEYSVTAYDIEPTAEELRSSVPNEPPPPHSLDVSDQMSQKMVVLAHQTTARANGNRYEQARLLQQYFRDSNRFTYRIERDRAVGMAAIEAFLFQDRTGYCVQFASAMTLLARVLGIPARMAIGFLPGNPGPDGVTRVMMHDLHAWPELYFDGIGWIRFEPTPARRASEIPPWTRPSGGASPPPSTRPTQHPSTPTRTPSTNRPDREPNTPDENGGPMGGGGWWSSTTVRWVAGGLGVLALLCVPWLIRSLIRRRRFAQPPGRAAVEGLWAEVRDTARDVGITWSANATPRQVGRELSRRLPRPVRPQVHRLARGVEAARYAGADPAGLDVREPAASVRRALWRQAPARRRWRARLFPPSWRWYLIRSSTEASDLLDRLDLALSQLRSRLLPRVAIRRGER